MLATVTEASYVWSSEVRTSADRLDVVSAHDTLGKFWETIVLTMIGETMDESDEICGARILDKVWVIYCR